jgi:hypothetical protein
MPLWRRKMAQKRLLSRFLSSVPAGIILCLWWFLRPVRRSAPVDATASMRAGPAEDLLKKLMLPFFPPPSASVARMETLA